jgi:hypothetical protein
MSVLIVWFSDARNPVAHVPTPVMPKLNAFNDFQAAANSFTEGDAASYSVVRAADAKKMEGMPAFTQAEIHADASRELAVVRLVRIGLTHPYQAQPFRHFSDPAPYFASDRKLARTLAFEGKFAGASGNWAADASDQVEAIELGNKMMQTSAVVANMVGIACCGMGRQHAWATIAHLDSAIARTDGLRLQASLASRPSMSQILQQQEWSDQASLANLKDWSSVYGIRFGPVRLSDYLQIQLLQTIFPRRVIFANYTQYMDREKKLQGLPYPIANAVKVEAPDDPFDATDINAVFPVREVRFKDTCDRAFTALLMTSFALQAYRLDHGAYPTRLSDLIPSYLSAVPVDPFSNNQPLRYRVKGSSYLLYSIGPDGIDDGGKPFVNHVGPGYETTKWCAQDTKGDIVAGLNPG